MAPETPEETRMWLRDQARERRKFYYCRNEKTAIYVWMTRPSEIDSNKGCGAV